MYFNRNLKNKKILLGNNARVMYLEELSFHRFLILIILIKKLNGVKEK